MRPSRQGAGATSGSYSPQGPLSYTLKQEGFSSTYCRSNRDSWPYATLRKQTSSSSSGPWSNHAVLTDGSTPSSVDEWFHTGFAYVRYQVVTITGETFTTDVWANPAP